LRERGRESEGAKEGERKGTRERWKDGETGRVRASEDQWTLRASHNKLLERKWEDRD